MQHYPSFNLSRFSSSLAPICSFESPYCRFELWFFFECEFLLFSLNCIENFDIWSSSFGFWWFSLHFDAGLNIENIRFDLSFSYVIFVVLSLGFLFLFFILFGSFLMYVAFFLV